MPASSPIIYDTHELADTWHLTVLGKGSMVRVNKPRRYLGTKVFKNDPGMLELLPPINSIGRVRYGLWQMAARAVLTQPTLKKKARIAGWELVVRVRVTRTSPWRDETIVAYQSRDNEPSIRRWVTMINTRLKRTLGDRVPR